MWSTPFSFGGLCLTKPFTAAAGCCEGNVIGEEKNVKVTSSFLIFFARGRPIASAGLRAFSRDGLRDCLCKKSGSFTGFSPLWPDKEVAKSYSRFSHRKGGLGWQWEACCCSPSPSPPPPSSAGLGGWAGREGRACGRPCEPPSGQRRPRRRGGDQRAGMQQTWGCHLGLRDVLAGRAGQIQGSQVAGRAGLREHHQLPGVASVARGRGVVAAAAIGGT